MPPSREAGLYAMFPDEETSQALQEMLDYFTDTGTSPVQVFKDLDNNEPTGRLSYWDFYKGFKNKGFKLDPKLAEKLMKLLDQDQSGLVELKAFEKVFDHLVFTAKKKEHLDAKAHPSAVWDQLCDALQAKGGTMTDQIIRFDTDKSGKLSYWEFSQGLKKQLGLRFDKKQTEQLLHDMDEVISFKHE